MTAQIGVPTGEMQEQARKARLAEVEAWLAECDAVAEGIEGEFDSVEDLRRIREERQRQLAAAAEALLPDYTAGGELTIFTTLDLCRRLPERWQLC